jgi:hypothetical protein
MVVPQFECNNLPKEFMMESNIENTQQLTNNQLLKVKCAEIAVSLGVPAGSFTVVATEVYNFIVETPRKLPLSIENKV